MEGYQEYEQEIDLKDLVFHVLYRWRSVMLVALLTGILSAGYAFWYNSAVFPEKRAGIEGELEEQLQLQKLFNQAGQIQGEEGNQEQAAEITKAQEKGLTAENVGKQIEELREQLEGLKELSPVKYFVLGFAAALFGMAFCHGTGYAFSDKLRREQELREKYGYHILGVFPRGGRKRFLGCIDRLLDRLEGNRACSSEEEIHRIISVGMMNLAKGGGTFLVTGTVGQERLQRLVDHLVQNLGEDMALIPGADMNVTADTLEALAVCDGVVLVEERGRSLRRQIHREHESIVAFGKTVVGYVVL